MLSVLREPMLLLLLAATAVYLVLGDAGEALLLAVSVLAVIGLTIYQEQKSERALEALRELGSPRARVLRDGSPRVLPAGALVVGDVILLAEGDRVPADARLLEDTDLHVDESLLSGESVPVRRHIGGPAEAALVHASTLVVSGHGIAVVALTLLARGDWTQAVLAGLTLAIATIPEEFPMVLAVFLALGAWRMARHQALVRRTPAIEALGAITVLCTDKTGTLTRNRMAVAELVAGDRRAPPRPTMDPALQALLQTAVLASRADSIDPMDRALADAVAALGTHPIAPGPDASDLLREYPLTPACTAVSHAWRRGAEILVACKGAPETVAGLCHVEAGPRAALLAEVDAMGRRGLRVLAVADARWHGDAALPPSMRDFDFGWRGLVAFADPLREGVVEAVAEAHAAGIRVVMLTGDHPATARAIAAQAGIAAGTRGVVEGHPLEAMDDDALLRCATGSNVFARVRPEQKLRLVAAFKRDGQVVAMTGDGVNDAPALMSAHVGIAMGQRGTDVAREAAAIVLLDDDFVTVVRAIRLGRTIYDNIRRAVHYILAVHVPIAGLRPAGAVAAARGVPRTDHRPGLQHRVRARIRGRRRGHHAAPATVAGGAPARRARPVRQPAARRGDVRRGGRGVCAGTRAGAAGGAGWRTGVHRAGHRQPRPDRGLPRR